MTLYCYGGNKYYIMMVQAPKVQPMQRNSINKDLVLTSMYKHSQLTQHQPIWIGWLKCAEILFDYYVVMSLPSPPLPQWGNAAVKLINIPIAPVALIHFQCMW